MKLWIDLDNSPHVLFFAPIIRELEKEGIEPVVTVRAFSQTEELAQRHGLRYTTIGAHHTPHSKFVRAAATLKRASQLVWHIRQHRPAAAVSHGSRAMTIAARALGIPCMVLFDYEFISSGLFTHLATQVMTPSLVPAARLGKLNGKLRQYPGFKEEVYVYDHRPSADVLRELALDRRQLIITVRPPATWAHYHNHQSVVLFRALVERLRREPNAQVLILARTRQQADQFIREYQLDSRPFRVLHRAVDGLSLMWYSDAVFSGGGTMVREAALLGVDAYSTFAGKLGAADRQLERLGKLKMLCQPEQIDELIFRKQPTGKIKDDGHRPTRKFIVQQLLELIQKCPSSIASGDNTCR